MSQQLKPPRKPAWQGFEPAQTAFAPVADAISLQIIPSLRRTGILHGRDIDRPGLVGHYHFFPTKDRGTPLFLKILPKDELATQLAADRIVRYLNKQGVPTTPLSADSPRSLNRQLVLLVYPLIKGRFPQLTQTDLQAIGFATAKLHNTLAALPFKDEIQTSTEKRDILLEKLRVEILAKNQRITSLTGQVSAILNQTDSTLPDSGRQVIHGDLNPGNILFAQESSIPYFIDFEDCRHSWLPSIVDLAMLIERCVLVKQQSDQRAEEKAKILLEAYKEMSRLGPTGDLGHTLRVLAARALLLLTRAEQSGNPPDREEWQKFTHLFQQTLDRKNLLNRLTVYLNR